MATPVEKRSGNINSLSLSPLRPYSSTPLPTSKRMKREGGSTYALPTTVSSSFSGQEERVSFLFQSLQFFLSGLWGREEEGPSSAGTVVTVVFPPLFEKGEG